MRFHQHSTNNMILAAPAGSKDVDDMPATLMAVGPEQTVLMASFWRPTPEELAELNKGGSVVLYVQGQFHPPVSIGVSRGG